MKKGKCLAVSLFIVLLFAACPPPGPGGGGSLPGNTVIITENITVPTVWENGYVYVIECYDFHVMSTLTIEAGTVVKFHTTLGPYLMLDPPGVIQANGTGLQPIFFTSFHDDAHGGDTNGDGAATTPARRDWGYINTDGCHGSSFNYCQFLYSGSVDFGQGLCVESGSTASVRNCVFAHGDGFQGYISGVLDAYSAGAGTVIQNNVFYDNEVPLAVNKLFSLDDSNVFHDPANPSQINTYNAVFVEDSDDFEANITWSETEVAYVIPGLQYWVNTGCTLTLGNNVVIKFQDDAELVLAAGGAIANYGGTGVAFTSYHDDARKGDSNGDGGATVPAHGDWLGIYNDATSLYVAWSTIYYNEY